MLSKTRHWLVLALLALLPFHALFVTVGTKIFVGPGHSPLTALAIWKELLLVAFFFIGGLELFSKRKMPKMDVAGILICVLFCLSILIAIIHYPLSIIHFSSFVFGFKYLF